MFEKQKKFAGNHIIFNNIHHFAGGFGLAILAQHYMTGDAFVSVMVGWVLVGFTLAAHAYEFNAVN